MIKNLWNKFVGWLFSWQEQEEEKAAHLQLYEDVPEPEVIKETITAEPEKIKCNTHSRFKKSCPICVEASK